MNNFGALMTVGKSILYSAVLVAGLASMLAACKDMGTDPVASPPPAHLGRTISFQQDIERIFTNPRAGCTGCHGGTNGLFLDTYAGLLRGGQHGPAVVPGNSGTSILVQKVGPNPLFGVRMPFGGIPIPDSSIQIIKDWIDQGALNN